MYQKVISCLEASPVIAAVRDKYFEKALNSPVDVIFLLGGKISTIEDRIKAVHNAGKYIFVHIDLAEGIGKDKYGIEFLSNCGTDGIISTKSFLIKAAADCGMLTVQRFFAYDSQGVESINDILAGSTPDIVEIMPGVIGKIIERFSKGHIPLIAGGLIETKHEVTSALNLGAFAVSTGKEELWYI